jgi:hypothetical protein
MAERYTGKGLNLLLLDAEEFTNWAEGYIKSEKGTVKLPKNDWFKAKAIVKGKDISIYVNNELVLEKKASYYLTSGYAGFFVGTATDAAFRKIKIEITADALKFSY